MSRAHRQHRTPLQGFLLGLLLCAWLAAQTLGLAHRSLHASALGALPQATVTQAAVTQAAVTQAAVTQAPHAHTGLFAGHAHAADCQLYDHAGVADLLVGVATLAFAATWATPVAAPLRAGLPARAAVPFQARAPPFLR